MTRFYLVKDRKRHGPYTLEELATSGLERTSLVWRQGMTTWMRADLLPELAELIITIPPPIPGGCVEAPASEAQATRPETFQTLSIWCTFLFLASMVSAGVAVIGYILWLDAKSQLTGMSWWNAFWNNPFHAHFGYMYIAPFRFNQLVGQLNAGAWMTAIGLIVAGLCFIPAVVLLCLFLHKSWSLVQDGKATTTPGMAVGLLFVPLFNLYWLFVAFYGLACELNRVAGDANLSRRVSTGLELTATV